MRQQLVEAADQFEAAATTDVTVVEGGAANAAPDTVNMVEAVEAADQFEAAATAGVTIVEGDVANAVPATVDMVKEVEATMQFEAFPSVTPRSKENTRKKLQKTRKKLKKMKMSVDACDSKSYSIVGA